MLGRIHRALVLTALVLASAAASERPQDPLAIPDVSTFDETVAALIGRAHARTLAEPSSAEAAGRLGMVLHAHGLFREARTAYERAVALDPSVFEWHYFLALALDRLNDLDAASRQMAASLAVRPGYLPARFRHAELLYRRGAFTESGIVYQAALDQHPDSALALYGLARVKQVESALEDARALYLRAVRAYPRFGAAYYALAAISQRLGLTGEARDFSRLASEHAEDRPPLDEPLLEELTAAATGIYSRIEDANSLVAEGRNEEAIRVYEELLAEDPENLNARLNLMRLASFLGRYEQVAELYRTAMAVHGEVADIHEIRAEALIRQGRTGEAREPLLRALGLNPSFVEALTLFGGVVEAEGQPQSALVYYQRALLVRPAYRPARYELGRLLLSLGRPADALPELLRVIDEDARDPRRPAITVSAMVLAATAHRLLDQPAAARLQLAAARDAAAARQIPQLLPAIDDEASRLPAGPSIP